MNCSKGQILLRYKQDKTKTKTKMRQVQGFVQKNTND